MIYDSLSPLFDMDQLVETIAKHGGIVSDWPPRDSTYYWKFILKDRTIIYSNIPMAVIYKQKDTPKSKEPKGCNLPCSSCLAKECSDRKED